MGKLLKLREWISVPVAARRLSTVCEEEITEADVLRMALDRKLVLSVHLVNHAYARCGYAKPIEQANYREAPELTDLVPSAIKAEVGDATPVVLVGTQVSDSYVVEFGDNVEILHGIYDLPLIGAERLDLEDRYQFLTDGPEVTLINLNGAFVVDSEGRLCQLQERVPEQIFDVNGLSKEVAAELTAAAERRKSRPRNHFINFHAAPTLPPDCTLVVRTKVLAEFESRECVGENERDTGWIGFDSDDPRYPEELDIALQAWLSVRNKPYSGSAKDLIEDWLKKSGHKLTENAIKRITTMCNWDKTGGRPTSD